MTANLQWLLSSTVLLVALEGAIFYFLPNWTRRDLYFAVTVDPAFRRTEEGQSILSRYRRQVMVHVLIALALVALWRGHVLLWQMGILWIIGGATVAFLRARREVMPHAAKPSTVREASLTPIHEGLPGGWIVQALPFAILAGVGIYLHLHWNQIPARFPIHWDLQGHASGWSTRTPEGVYLPLIIAAGVCGTMLLMALLIKYTSARIYTSRTMAAKQMEFRRAVFWVLLGVEFVITFSFGWVGLFPLRSRPTASPAAPTAWFVVLTITFALAAIVVLARANLGGMRVAEAAGEATEAPASLAGDGTEDRFWKAGMFYFNRNDPALMVEQRFGLGYTFNFARPMAWVIAGATLALPVLIIFHGQVVHALVWAYRRLASSR